MTLFGDSRINVSPCNPGDDAKNWSIVKNQLDVIDQLFQTIVLGSSDHKFSISTADETVGGAGYALDKLSNNGTYDAGNDRLCRVEDNGDGTIRIFVRVSDLGGGGGGGGTGVDTFKVRVSTSGTDTEDFLINKVNPVSTKGTNDPTVSFRDNSGKLEAFFKVDPVATFDPSTQVQASFRLHLGKLQEFVPAADIISLGGDAIANIVNNSIVYFAFFGGSIAAGTVSDSAGVVTFTPQPFAAKLLTQSGTGYTCNDSDDNVTIYNDSLDIYGPFPSPSITIGQALRHQDGTYHMLIPLGCGYYIPP